MPRYPNLEPSRVFVMKMPPEMHRRLSLAAQNHRRCHPSMAQIVLAALSAYLPTLDQLPRDFDDYWDDHLSPAEVYREITPMARLYSYGGDYINNMSQQRLFSETLREHMRQRLWDARTWAMIRREWRWREEMSLPLNSGLPFPGMDSRDECDIPPIARDELGPHGKP